MKNPILRVFALTLALVVCLLPSMSEADEEIGFLETFALAEDREEALKQLIPGTESYYYFHALQAQSEGKHDAVTALLEPWVKRYGETQLVWEIRHRAALLRYPDQQKESLEYLRHRLGLNFGHQQEKRNAKPNYPTELKPNQVDWKAFQATAFRHSSTLNQIKDSGSTGCCVMTSSSTKSDVGICSSD